MDWVRLYHDMPADPKWRVIAKKAGQRIGDVIAVYVFLLTNASNNEVKRGVTHGFVSEDVAAAIDLEEDGVTAILDAMEGKVVKDGLLLGWEKRNPKREDSSTERVRKHRETQRNAEKRPEEELETEKKEPSLRDGAGASQAKPPPKLRAASRRSLPEDFPGEADRQWAATLWLQRGRADLCERLADEASSFRDHHAAHGKTMADWPAAWRTWAKNALKFNRAARPSQPDKPDWKPLKVVGE